MSFNLNSRINNLAAQASDILNNVTEIKGNVSDINNSLATKQDNLIHTPLIGGCSVIDTDSNIRNMFGVYPLEINYYIGPFNNEGRNNQLQVSYDSNSTYPLKLIDVSPLSIDESN